MVVFSLLLLTFAIITGFMIVFGTSGETPAGSLGDEPEAPDYAGLPEVGLLPDRQGGGIAYRRYCCPGSKKVAILVHGTVSDSRSLHTFALYFQALGIECYVPDIRGHGATGRKGDIDHIGQLEEDLEDLVQLIRREHGLKELILLGHSGGGGFCLRFAGSRRGSLFDRYVLLAPMIYHASPMSRPSVGGHAVSFNLRIAGLTILDSLGLRWFQSLPVLLFAAPGGEESSSRTTVYSYRLQANFRPHLCWKRDVRGVSRPMAVIIGAEDELFEAQAYKTYLEALNRNISVRILLGITHLSILSDSAAYAAVSESLYRDPNSLTST